MLSSKMLSSSLRCCPKNRKTATRTMWAAQPHKDQPHMRLIHQVVLIHGPQQQEYEAPPCYPLPCFPSFILELTAWWIFQGHAWSPNLEARNWQSIPDADPENSVVCALTWAHLPVLHLHITSQMGKLSLGGPVILPPPTNCSQITLQSCYKSIKLFHAISKERGFPVHSAWTKKVCMV